MLMILTCKNDGPPLTRLLLLILISKGGHTGGGAWDGIYLCGSVDQPNALGKKISLFDYLSF